MPEKLFNIPAHWTAEQADAVFEILFDLETAIFAAYKDPLVRLAIREAQEPTSNDLHPKLDIENDDSEIPW